MKSRDELMVLVDGKNSCVPPWKLVNLWETVKICPDGDILEVGSWRGGTSLMIAASSAEHRPTSKVYICDTFEGIVLSGPNDNFHKDGDFSGTTSKELVEELLSSQGLENFKVLKGIFPHDTGNQVDSEKIAFVHIDVDVYNGHMEIFKWLEGRLVNGAIIIFDDYGSPSCQGATKAVHEYFDNRSDFKLHIAKDTKFHSFAQFKKL
jgi:O-methyltransferase